MKRHFWLIGALFFTSFTLSAQGTQKNEKPRSESTNLEQSAGITDAAILKSVQEQILSELVDLEKQANDLKGLGRIDRQGDTIVQLQSVLETFYGFGNQYLLNQTARIHWKDGKVDSLIFDVRRGHAFTAYVNRKLFQAIPISSTSLDSTKFDLLSIVRYNSEVSEYINFRFPASPGEVDHSEDMQVDGVRRPVMVSYVRNVRAQIGALRQYLDLLRLLNRRVDYVIDSGNENSAKGMERALRELNSP